MWLLGIDWDAPLLEEDARRWLEFQEEPNLEDIQIPRWISGELHSCRVEIHGFTDASERAYATVVYVRPEDLSGTVQVRLIAAKTKVAPLK